MAVLTVQTPTHRARKVQVVEDLQARIRRAKAVTLVRFRAIGVEELQGLRRRLRESGGELRVAKNTLARLAVQGTEAAPLSEQFRGQVMTVLSYQDPVAPLKVVMEADTQGERLQFLAGLVEHVVLSGPALRAVAALPGRTTLLTTLVTRLKAPLVALHFVVAGPIRLFVAILTTIRQSQEKEAHMATETTKFSKETFIQTIEGMTVLELSDLIKGLEERFGITAAAAMATAPGASPTASAAPVEEQTSFDVVLTQIQSDKKILAIKVVREVTQLGLKEAKDLVESVPKTVRTGLSKEEAETVREKLAAVGAKVEVQ